MKTLFYLTLSLCFAQCTRPDPIPTLAERSTQLLTELKPKITGTWSLNQVQINHRELGYFATSPGITKDTLLPYLATVTIQPASSVNRRFPQRPDLNELEGTVTFRGQTYPIYGWLMAGPSREPDSSELRGYIGLQYNLPAGLSGPVPAEQTYLRGIGLMNDTFEIELTSDKTAIWRGMGRAIVRTDLQKQ